MKRFLGVLVSIIISLSIIGCGSGKELKDSKNNKETQAVNSTATTVEESKDTEDKIVEMTLGTPYCTSEEDGSNKYAVMIEGIRFTDERNEFSEINATHVFYLDFYYENISSSNDIFISSSNFKVIDEEGNMLKSYPVIDNNRTSQSIPVGAKCSASEAYALTNESKTIKVLFYDNMFMDPLGEITIETGL